MNRFVVFCLTLMVLMALLLVYLYCQCRRQDVNGYKPARRGKGSALNGSGGAKSSYNGFKLVSREEKNLFDDSDAEDSEEYEFLGSNGHANGNRAKGDFSMRVRTCARAVSRD